jgi:hypothetical protein
MLSALETKLQDGFFKVPARNWDTTQNRVSTTNINDVADYADESEEYVYFVALPTEQEARNIALSNLDELVTYEPFVAIVEKARALWSSVTAWKSWYPPMARAPITTQLISSLSLASPRSVIVVQNTCDAQGLWKPTD